MATITAVACAVRPFSRGTWLDEQKIASPMSVFPRFAASRSSWRGPGADLVTVLVRADDGLYGVGQTRGGTVVEAMIRDQFTPMLLGSDAGQIATRTEEIRRAAGPFARGGVASLAVSAVELALWDLEARAAGQPLARVLGGTEHVELPTYVTCRAPEQLKGIAKSAVESLRAVKVGVPYGPVDGPEGLGGNLDLLRAFRERIPDSVPLAVDCFMGWDEAYTVEFTRRAGELNLAWIEEPLPPEDVDGYARLRGRLGPVRLAAGEHLFGLAEGLRYLDAGCVDIIQPDVTWCGGIRVAATLAAVAQERGVTFAPHAGGIQPWATHLLAACGPGVLAEVLLGLGDPPVLPVKPAKGVGAGVSPEPYGLQP
ncbi:MAG TPA: enolase C-terminal domain-like protein [Acidimicrobiales bacterium]|nr:enolase C-terminal domain-like protein [Acidimicrobiales bacterium]